MKTKKNVQGSKLFIIVFLVLTLAFGWFVYQKTLPPPDEGEQGINRVVNLKEVRDFKKEVEQGGRSKFGVSVGAEPTKDNPYYLIQVFESFPDHRTTFRWYRYFPETGKIFTQFLERATTDNWDEVGY